MSFIVWILWHNEHSRIIFHFLCVKTISRYWLILFHVRIWTEIHASHFLLATLTRVFFYNKFTNHVCLLVAFHTSHTNFCPHHVSRIYNPLPPSRKVFLLYFQPLSTSVTFRFTMFRNILRRSWNELIKVQHTFITKRAS